MKKKVSNEVVMVKDMIRMLLFVSIGLCMVAPALHAGNIPKSIAGITLGNNVKSYPEIMDSNFLKDVVVTDWHGFRKGTISYGVCLHPDKILKIDMKYEDRSKKLFKQVLKKLKTKYGEPDWNGDSFGLKHIWKWHFTDENGDRVTMKLQHNVKDSAETLGNMIKLAYPDKIDEERSCFADMCHQNREQIDLQRKEELKKTDWSYLVPQ